MQRRLGLSLLLVVLGCLGLSLPAHSALADSAVTIGVGDTTAAISGETAPNSFVSIKDGDNVIATTTSGNDGTFSKQLIAQQPGIHDLTFYSKTPTNQTSDATLLSVNFWEHRATDVSVFLPPTLQLSGSDISAGNELQAQGYTLPVAKVLILIDQATQLQTSADADGRWNYRMPPGVLKPGNHSIIVYATDAQGAQSTPTMPRFFTIVAAGSQSVTGTSSSGGSARHAVAAALKAPTIIQPRNDSVATSRHISIAGTSEARAQIELWRNHKLVGSAFADAHGGWIIDTSLQTGENALSARVCAGSACSEFSRVVTVHYNPIDGPMLALRVLLEHYRYQIKAGQSIQLSTTVTEGVAPYSVSIDWGDAVMQNARLSDSQTTFSHSYGRSGQYNGVITVRDAKGFVVRNNFSVSVANAAGIWPIVRDGALILLVLVVAWAVTSTRGGQSLGLETSPLRWLLKALRR